MTDKKKQELKNERQVLEDWEAQIDVVPTKEDISKEKEQTKERHILKSSSTISLAGSSTKSGINPLMQNILSKRKSILSSPLNLDGLQDNTKEIDTKKIFWTNGDIFTNYL